MLWVIIYFMFIYTRYLNCTFNVVSQSQLWLKQYKTFLGRPNQAYKLYVPRYSNSLTFSNNGGNKEMNFFLYSLRYVFYVNCILNYSHDSCWFKIKENHTKTQ